MSGRESIENLWSRSLPVAPLLDQYRDEIRHGVAEELRAIAEHCYNMAAPGMDYAGYKALLDAADVISPGEQP